MRCEKLGCSRLIYSAALCRYSGNFWSHGQSSLSFYDLGVTASFITFVDCSLIRGCSQTESIKDDESEERQIIDLHIP